MLSFVQCTQIEQTTTETDICMWTFITQRMAPLQHKTHLIIAPISNIDNKWESSLPYIDFHTMSCFPYINSMLQNGETQSDK